METDRLVESVRRIGLAALTSTRAVREELDRALRGIAPEMDSFLVFDEEDGDLRCVAASGSRVSYFGGIKIARGDGKTLPSLALALEHRVTFGSHGIRGFHPGDAFAVAAPLARDRDRKSVAYAAGRAAVDARTIDAIVLLIDHAGFAYSLAHEREAQQQRAEYDALTGLFSPRALREKLSALLDAARHAPLARVALVFVDTDHFKAWNDTHGHASGDALLRALARVLRGAAAPDDIAARNGGDEFCVVFADTEKSQAVVRAERLRAAIEALDTAALLPPGAPSTVAITASIGVAAYPADAATPNGLLERADELMYHSKRAGRNAVSYVDAGGALCRLPSAALLAKT